MTDYELTRRDAIAALATAGITSLSVSELTWPSSDSGSKAAQRPLSDEHRDLLLAVADVIYPSTVSGVSKFVETFVLGRHTDDPERLRGMADALEYLDSYAMEWHDGPFLELSPEERETVMRAMGADVVEPDPTGGDVFQFRFYVVNELLYALYSSPTGGDLLGLENPQGYPGGTDSYQHPPE
jgi:hypothetical protein